MKRLLLLSVMVLCVLTDSLSVACSAQSWSWQGTWSSSVNYSTNNVVYYNGSSYLCLVGNINIAPPSSPTDWALVAQAGAAGATGSAANVSVGYTVTGAPFTSATVTNSGSSSNAVLNFTIPQGDAGGGYPGVGSDGANGLTVIGDVNAASFECNGTPLSTGCLADWTNAGITNGQIPVWNSSTGKWTPGSGSGTGTVNSATAYSPAFYPATGTTIGGTTPFDGLGWWSTSAAPQAATASNVLSVIGTNPVTNASNVANTGGVTTNAAFYPCLLSANSTGYYPCNTTSSLAFNPSTNVLSVPQISSTVATGTPPFAVTSTTPVANLSIGGNAATATGLSSNGSALQVWSMDPTGTFQQWSTPSASIASLAVGSTSVSGGTNNYILYINSGILGNLPITGSGSVVLSASPSISGQINYNTIQYFPDGFTTNDSSQIASCTATSLANCDSTYYGWNGSYWNGSAPRTDAWQWNDVLGTGTNPTSTFTLAQTGSTGTTSVSMPYPLTISALTDTGAASGSGEYCLQINTAGLISNTGATCSGGGSGAVNSVANSDSTLTISPTTGAVVASLALGHANTWTATQTFPSASITNSELANSSFTPNGATCTLGSSCNVTDYVAGANTTNAAMYPLFVQNANNSTPGNYQSRTASGLSFNPSTGALSATSLNGTVIASNLTISSVSGSTQCLVANSSGLVSGIGAPCGSGTVSGQASGVVPLASSSTAITGQSHLSESAGVDIFSQYVQTPGVNDTTQGLPVFPNLVKPSTSGVGGGTDVCSYFAQQNLNDYTNGVTGAFYHDNTTTSQKCTLGTFWNPALQTATSNLQMGIRTTLSGHPYLMPGPVNVPAWTTLTCDSQSGSTHGSGCLIQPDNSTPNFARQAYGLNNPTPMVNLGPPQGTSGAPFTLNSIVDGVNISCAGYLNMVGGRNSFGQQFSGFRNTAISNCGTGVQIDATGSNGSGGSINRGELYGLIISMPASSSAIVMTQLKATSGGSGYSTASFVYSGFSTNPTFTATIVGGAVTLALPSAAATNPFGVCPAPASCTVSVTGDGTGAVVVPTFETMAPSEGIYLASTAGAGETREISIVNGATGIVPAYGIDDETATQQSFYNIYGESVWCPLCFNTSSGVFGLSIHGVHSSTANSNVYAMVENGGKALSSFEIDGVEGSGQNVFVDKGIAPFVVPSLAALENSGNGGSLAFLAKAISGNMLTISQNLVNSVEVGALAYQCGASCTSTAFPRPGYPLEMTPDGYVEAMTPGDGNEIWGVGGQQCQANQSTTGMCSIAVTGQVAPMFWGNTPVPGDYWETCTTGSQPALACDTGSASPPASGWTGGKVIYDGVGGSDATLPTPSSSGMGSTVSNPSTISVSYELVNTTQTDWGVSAPSVAYTLSNGPQSIGGGSTITLTGIPNANPHNTALYRTALGRTSLPTISAHCNTTSGTYDYLIITGTINGYWFAPSVAFSAGAGVAPTVTLGTTGTSLYWTFNTYGSGCTGNATGTVTASACETGFLRFTNQSTSTIDEGQCGEALPGQITNTPPSAAIVGARATVHPQYWNGPGITSAALNQVPNTGFKSEPGGFWTLASGFSILSNGDPNPDTGGNALQYTGTGSSSGAIQTYAKPVYLTNGQFYSMSTAVNSTNLTSGTIEVAVCSTPSCGTIYGHLGTFGAINQPWIASNFQATVTGPAYFVYIFNNVVVPNGQTITFAEPMVGRVLNSTSLLGYAPNDGPGQGDNVSGIQSGMAATFPYTSSSATVTFTAGSSSILGSGGSYSAPTCLAGATCTMQSGIVGFNTGASPASTGSMFTVNYPLTTSTVRVCQWQPFTYPSGTPPIVGAFSMTTSSSQAVTGTVLTANTAYAYIYLCN